MYYNDSCPIVECPVTLIMNCMIISESVTRELPDSIACDQVVHEVFFTALHVVKFASNINCTHLRGIPGRLPNPDVVRDMRLLRCHHSSIMCTHSCG